MNHAHKICHTARDGLSYTITIDEEGECIELFLSDKHVGTIRLTFDPDVLRVEEWQFFDFFYINELSLGKCKRLGLGEAALRFHKLCFGSKIAAGPDDGTIMYDGSHLIGDGPPFIAAMRRKGVVI